MRQPEDITLLRCGNAQCRNIIGCLKGNLVEIRKSGRTVIFRTMPKQKIKIVCEKCKKCTEITIEKHKEGENKCQITTR